MYMYTRGCCFKPTLRVLPPIGLTQGLTRRRVYEFVDAARYVFYIYKERAIEIDVHV